MEYIVGLVAIILLPILIKMIDRGYKVFKGTEMSQDLKKLLED